MLTRNDSPYKVSLAVQPPKKPLNANGNFTSTSFSPLAPSAPDPHVYHKALLKKLNFVLDHEAKTEFPQDVDVLLAWGKLEYTMTQYVHRSGVILAQITGDGSFLLLANRLYNNRSSTTKDHSNKFTSDPTRRDRNVSRTRAKTVGQTTMQASGVLGLNAPAPSSPGLSPMVRASADVFGNRAALASSGLASYITPEQIKDELEAFASSASTLEAFYREVANTLAGPPVRKSSSSMLRPDRGPDMGTIPEIRLPESLVVRTQAEGGGGNAGKRVSSREQGQGSPLVKAETEDEISEAMKSPMRGATL
jgi:DEP domain-containing protein 5